LCLAVSAACLTSVGLYAVCRTVQAALLPVPSLAAPALIIAGGHAAYFWRAWTVSYAGVMVGFLAFAVAPAHEACLARGMVRALSIAVPVLVVQAIILP
jgi:hypothetical protein